LVLALRQLRRRDGAIAVRFHGRLGAGWRDLGQIVWIGLPKAATGILFSGIYMALTRITSSFGTPNIAALRIGHIYEGITFLSAVGFSIAAGAHVGQNLGASQPKRAGRAAWTTSGIVALYTALIGVAFYLFPLPLARVFTIDPHVAAAAALYLTILAVSQPFMGTEIVLEGSFSGAGNTIPPMMIQLPITALRYPAAYLLAFHTDLGVAGVWWAISGSSILKCLLMAWWFRKGRWARTEI
jgi:Na+-driven multidrug efflux pump